jgi:hypothetical protein
MFNINKYFKFCWTMKIRVLTLLTHESHTTYVRFEPIKNILITDAERINGS